MPSLFLSFLSKEEEVTIPLCSAQRYEEYRPNIPYVSLKGTCGGLPRHRIRRKICPKPFHCKLGERLGFYRHFLPKSDTFPFARVGPSNAGGDSSPRGKRKANLVCAIHLLFRRFPLPTVDVDALEKHLAPKVGSEVTPFAVGFLDLVAGNASKMPLETWATCSKRLSLAHAAKQ
uniref:Uncharacterized protein n=1 Tax=Cannabis sativa TaxID=3483 RepID=A0A803PJ97_CANSA